MQKRLLLPCTGAAALDLVGRATADDKDLLKAGSAPPNVMIVFGNSQTTEQPIQGSTSAWDGDGDSPASKMGAAKRVVRQFINDKHTGFNFGMTTFSHNPNAGSISISGKHWLYSPLTVDFPLDTWAEPAGTIERWGLNGEGPCTTVTVPACADRSSGSVTAALRRRRRRRALLRMPGYRRGLHLSRRNGGQQGDPKTPRENPGHSDPGQVRRRLHGRQPFA